MGFLSDFAAIPSSERNDLWTRHEELFTQYFHEIIGRILTFYPENPAAWLVRQDLIEEGGHVDPDVELGGLRSIIRDSYDSHSELASCATLFAFGRLLKHDKIKFAAEVEEIVDLLRRYPEYCSEEEKRTVESFTRVSVVAVYTNEKRYKERDWPRYFWKHNLDIAICRPVERVIEGSEPADEQQMQRLCEVMRRNRELAGKYLEKLRIQAIYDLYEPEHDEILLGLFARLTRFYILMMGDPNLWARDVAGVLLRCLADTCITFGYLAKCGSGEDFERFRKYGEGQEKLLMLHLQDSYEGERSLDGRNVQTIGDELGWLTPELMDIELGHWAGKDTRKLAQDAGMEKFYRLVFTPTSSHLHGSWMSLKHSNLCHCNEPLHRFHRLPTYLEPPLFVDTMIAAQGMFEECVCIGRKKLGYPDLDEQLESLLPEQSDDCKTSAS